VKQKKKANITGTYDVYIKDVADIVAESSICPQINSLKILKINENNEHKKNYLVSITDIIKVIKKKYPNATINNVGEMDTLVQYKSEKSKDVSWLKWLKVAFISLVLMVGSATAIMSFHTDGQIPKIFETYFRLFYGFEKTNPLIISIPYSIGLAVGIMVFYNHFLGKKITDDPTPIDVEIELYDNDVTEAVVDMLSRKAGEQSGDS